MRRLQILGAPTTILVLRWFGILSALVFRRFRQLLVFLGAILLLHRHQRRPPAAPGTLPPVGRPHPGRLERLLPPVPADGRHRRLPHRPHLPARPPGRVAVPGQVPGRRLHRLPVRDPALPGRRPSHRHPLRRHPRRDHHPDGLPAPRTDRRLPDHLPPGTQRPPRRRRPARARRSRPRSASSSAFPPSTCGPSASTAPPARRRCGSPWPTRTPRCCSASSTRPRTCGRTAGTSWAGPSSTAGWRTSPRSRRSAASSSTRTTCCTS